MTSTTPCPVRRPLCLVAANKRMIEEEEEEASEKKEEEELTVVDSLDLTTRLDSQFEGKEGHLSSVRPAAKHALRSLRPSQTP